MWLPRLARSAALALAAGACGATPAEQAPVPDAHAAVLPGSAVTMMLEQCSRSTPASGEARWQPGGAEIAAVDTAVVAALRAEGRIQRDLAAFPSGWLRQFVGIVRGGRRFIYANYVLREGANPLGYSESWRTEPVIVCDGGPAYFGAEYDVDSGRITHLEFNGSV